MIYLRTYDAPPVDEREILRYAGMRDGAERMSESLGECLNEALGALSYKVCFGEFDLAEKDGAIDLGFAVTQSESLGRSLRGCDRAVVFAATVGIGLDRLVSRYSRLSPSRALLLDAIGTERIEALCDTFCAELSKEAAERGETVTARFSPGYGDLPLEMQREIFLALGCHLKIGLSLNQSLVMSPSKSVTAIVGIRRNR